MNTSKPGSDSVPDPVTYRRLMAERAVRARRADKIEKAITEVIIDLIVISLAAWALMAGLKGLGNPASYFTCVALVVAARITFGIKIKFDK